MLSDEDYGRLQEIRDILDEPTEASQETLLYSLRNHVSEIIEILLRSDTVK